MSLDHYYPSQLKGELSYIGHWSSVYEQNNIVNSVRVDDRTADWAIMVTNESIRKPGFNMVLYMDQNVAVCFSTTYKHVWINIQIFKF